MNEIRAPMLRPAISAPFLRSLRELVALAVPIAGVQVGLMLIGITDLVIVGRVSATALAAVALGHVYFFAPYGFCLGFMSVLDPLVAQGLGAGDQAQVTLAVQRGIVVSVVLAALTSLVYIPVEPVLRLLREPPEVVPQAASFVHASVPGVLPAIMFLVFRQTLQAMQRPRAVVVTIVAANVFNALLCSMLVFGWFGLPRLGVAGAAWAGTASRWLMLILLFLIARDELLPRLVPFHRGALDARALARLVTLGAPLGATALLEFGVFLIVAVMMGQFGTVAVAGHQVAISLASLTFMIPLGISGAAAVVVGHAVGRGDSSAARHGAAAALVVGVAWMLLTSVTFLLVPRPLAMLYTIVPEVVALVGVLLPIAGVFQVFDGIQVVSVGVLRGLGDTRAPMWINILGFWLIGFPVSLALGFGFHLGPPGLWWGFVAGLGAVAMLLLARTRSRLGRALERVRVDDPIQAAGI